MAGIWVVAHDFSEYAEAAVACAGRDATALGAEVHLVHVLNPVEVASNLDWHHRRDSAASWESELAAARRRASERIQRAVERFGEEYPGIRATGMVRDDYPADGVLAVAAEVGATRIVIGSHGRRGFRRFVVGSVAERVVRLAERPVLVVKGAVDEGASQGS